MKKLILTIALLTISLYPQSKLLLLMGGEGYKNAETKLYLEGQTVSPTQATRIDNFITLVKTNLGISSLSEKFDVMYLFANETDALSKRNLVKRAHDCTEGGTVNFTQWEGQAGNGTNGYLNTHFDPVPDGVKYTLDNAAFGYYARSLDATDGIWDMGADSASIRTAIMGNFDADTPGKRVYINGGFTLSTNRTFGIGLKIFTRPNSTTTYSYLNGGNQQTALKSSSGLPTRPFYICAVNSVGTATGFTTTQISFAFIGASLSSAEVAGLTNCIEWYMDDLGKGVIP